MLLLGSFWLLVLFSAQQTRVDRVTETMALVLSQDLAQTRVSSESLTDVVTDAEITSYKDHTEYVSLLHFSYTVSM